MVVVGRKWMEWLSALHVMEGRTSKASPHSLAICNASLPHLDI